MPQKDEDKLANDKSKSEAASASSSDKSADAKPQKKVVEAKTAAKPDAAAPKPSPVSPKQQKKASGKGLSIFVLLLALVGIGIAIYNLFQHQALVQHIADNPFDTRNLATKSEVQRISEAQEHASTSSLRQIADIQAQTKLFQERLKLPEQNIVRLEQEIDRLNTELKMTQGQLSHLPKSYSDAEIQWILARGEFLINTADNQLRLTRDVSGAIAALSAAEDILREAAHPALLPLREKLRQDIELLNAVPTIQRNDIIATVDALIHETASLSIDEVPSRWPLKPLESDDDQLVQAAESAGQKIMNALRGIVDIRRGKRAQALFLGPDEHFILLQNITLRLETVKASVLAQNKTAYVGTLNHIKAWISEFFDAQDEHVAGVLGQIDSLLTHDIAPVLPTLEQSHQSLIQTRRELSMGAGNEGI